MAMQNISATIDESLLRKLGELAEASERNRSWLIAKAIEFYLEELEDLEVASKRLKEERLTPSALKKELRS